MSIFYTGDDWDISVKLKTDGSATNVSGATEIKGALVSDNSDSPTTLIPAVTLNPLATGADWANGIVVVEFPSASTDIVTGDHLLEIQVQEGGKKKTWPRLQLDIRKGTIS